MIYLYRCPTHGDFDVWKPVKDFDREERCLECGAVAERVLCAPRAFINAAVEHAEWNPGLGQVVKNRAHRAEICKQKGLIEVGTETPDSMERHQQHERTKRMAYED